MTTSAWSCMPPSGIRRPRLPSGEATRLDPANVDAHNDLGRVLRAAERYPEAEAVLREAIRLDPSFAWAHANLGRVLLETHRYPEAGLPSARRSASTRPTPTRTTTSAGSCVPPSGIRRPRPFPGPPSGKTRLGLIGIPLARRLKRMPTLSGKHRERSIRVLIEAERIAQSITEKSWQATALAAVARVLAITDPDRAARLIAKAETVAKSIDAKAKKEDTLAVVARIMAVTNPGWAERIAQSITRRILKVGVVAAVARALYSIPTRTTRPSSSPTRNA